MSSGVYAICCTVTGRTYVGSSVDVANRWSQHRSDLGLGRHANQILQRAWIKYGSAAFTFRLLEKAFERDLLVRETYWMEVLGTLRSRIGFNIRGPVDGVHAAKKYIITHPDGHEEPIVNLKAYCRDNGLNYKPMFRIAHWQNDYHRGYHARTESTMEGWRVERATQTINRKEKADAKPPWETFVDGVFS